MYFRILVLGMGTVFALETEAPFLDQRSEAQGVFGVRTINSWSYHPWDQAGARDYKTDFNPAYIDLGNGSESLLSIDSWRDGSRLILGNEVGDPLWRETIPNEQTNNRTPTFQMMAAVPYGQNLYKVGLEQIDHFQSRSIGSRALYGQQVGIVPDDWSWQGENYSGYSMGLVYARLGHPKQLHSEIGYREGWYWFPHSTDANEDPLYLRLGQIHASEPNSGTQFYGKVWQEQKLGTDSSSYGQQATLAQNTPWFQLSGNFWNWNGNTHQSELHGSRFWLNISRSDTVGNLRSSQEFLLDHLSQFGLKGQLALQLPVEIGTEYALGQRNPLHPQNDLRASELQPYLAWNFKTEDHSFRIFEKALIAADQNTGSLGRQNSTLLHPIYANRTGFEFSSRIWDWFSLGGRHFWEQRYGDSWQELALQSPLWSGWQSILIKLPEDLEISMEIMGESPAHYRINADSTWSSPWIFEPSVSISQSWFDRKLQAYAGIINFSSEDQILHPWGNDNRFRINVKVAYHLQ